MNNNNKNYYRLKDDIDWDGEKKYARIIYRVWWMVALNLLLKILQPFTRNPLVVCVYSEIDDNGDPHFIRYSLRRIHFDDGYFERVKGVFLSHRYCVRYYNE